MGLGVVAYAKLEKVTDERAERVRSAECVYEACDEEDLLHFLVQEEAFPGRERPLEKGEFYETGEGSRHMRAGSYSGYGEWRRQLAALVGIDDIEDFWRRVGEQVERGEEPNVPFWKLLHFSDCEGVIGAEACGELAAQFAEWRGRALEHARARFREECPISDEEFSEEGRGWTRAEHFWAKYREWQQMFEFAADGGAVQFC